MAGKKKIRIELEDAEGDKYNFSIEGNLSKEKIAKVVEFMDLLNLEKVGEDAQNEGPEEKKIPASVGGKIWELVETNFPYSAFTSTDILELYEDRYNEPIKLSTVSTYLSRYSDRGTLVRNRQGKEWIYKRARPTAVPGALRQPELQHHQRYRASEGGFDLETSTAPDLRR